MTRMSDIPPEMLAEMTPAVRAIVESLLVQMAEMKARMQAEIDEHHDNQVKRLRFDLKRQVGMMFSIWHRDKSGEISWETFQAQMQPVRDTVNHLLLRGRCSGNTRLKGMCKKLYVTANTSGTTSGSKSFVKCFLLTVSQCFHGD